MGCWYCPKCGKENCLIDNECSCGYDRKKSKSFNIKKDKIKRAKQMYKDGKNLKEIAECFDVIKETAKRWINS